MREGGGIDVARAGGAQGRRARVQRGARRQHIVHNDVTPVWVDLRSLGEAEGAADVRPAFLPVEPRLGEGLGLLAEQRRGGAPW